MAIHGPAIFRDFRNPEPDLDNASILITGGTGSFGRELAKTIISRYRPKKTIIFSRDEFKQSDMAQDFPGNENPSIRFFIGDIRDCDRLELAMRNVDYIFHGAALKQVPAAEYNPIECIKTNIMGAENVVRASIRANVKKIIALSTDKAANPINLYGASKLASDKIFVAANNLSGEDGPRFSVVRYGNVLNSRGSVLPLFRKLIDDKAESLPITDPEMTRFWITLKQGINFVLSSLAMMRGGEIFIPKIPSMRATDMAEAIAPGKKQHTIGPRPGEKLHEIMITPDDARDTLELDDRYIIKPAFHFSGEKFQTINGARQVGERFSYASNTNTEWMDKGGLLSLLNEESI